MMEKAAKKKRRGLVRRYYDWTMVHAQGPHAWITLGLVSFTESSFFPIPGDLFLWEEVESALRKKDPQRLVFESKDVLSRVDKIGDLFGPVLALKQNLPQLAGLAATSEPAESIAIAAQADRSPRSKKRAPTRPRRKV